MRVIQRRECRGVASLRGENDSIERWRRGGGQLRGRVQEQVPDQDRARTSSNGMPVAVGGFSDRRAGSGRRDRSKLPDMPPVRPRPLYAALLLGTVGLGLASRHYASALPGFIARYAGDVLWASMMVWLVAIVRPRESTPRVAITALLIAFTVEASQLYHAAWIDATRSTRIGALVLGVGFLWSDLVCYSVGVASTAIVDGLLSRLCSTEDSEVPAADVSTH
jgi:hypothetical protein